MEIETILERCDKNQNEPKPKHYHHNKRTFRKLEILLKKLTIKNQLTISAALENNTISCTILHATLTQMIDKLQPFQGK